MTTKPMLKTFNLSVRPFAGSDITDVCIELCELANRIGVRCEAEFNGVNLWARPGDDPAQLVNAFYEQIRLADHLYKIAQAE